MCEPMLDADRCLRDLDRKLDRVLRGHDVNVIDVANIDDDEDET